MAVTYSEAAELGTQAPPFDLPIANPDVDSRGGDRRSIDDYSDATALVVVFTCNHCPYARHVEDALVQTAKTYAERGVQTIAINPNDPAKYPDDSFESMSRRAKDKGFSFPYLFDETQDVARAYGAACTPDFFVYDAERSLVYRGRYDATRPGKGKATGEELHTALDQLLETGRITIDQYPSIGCSIKWR